MKPPRIFSAARLSFPLASALATLLAVSLSSAQSTYVWDSTNVTGTPASTLDWFTPGPNTQGTWIGGTPLSSNLNTIKFFQGIALPNTANPSTQTSNINNGGSAFQLGTLTLSGLASSTVNANLTMNISGDALNFSAATGRINLDALNATRTITYNVNSNIQLGTAGSAGALTLTGNGTSAFNFGGIISELQVGGGSLIKSGTSTVSLTGANTYTGTTTINGGTLNVSGTAGTINLSSAVTVGSGATLGLDNALGSLDRIKDSSTLTLNGGTLIFTGRGSSGSTTETIDTLAIGAGGSTITLTGAGAGQLQTLAASAFSRTGNGTALIRGTSLQTAATNSTRLSITGGTGLTLIGGGTENNGTSSGTTKTLSIVPYLIGDTSATGNGSSFLTYDLSGALRPLAAGEYQALSAGYSTPGTPENVTAFSGTITTGSLVTVNSLLFNTATQTLVGTGALQVNSGAIAATAATGIINGFTGITLGSGTWNEGIITATGSNVLTINAPITINNNGVLTKAGAGIVAITGTIGAGTSTGLVVNAGTLRLSAAQSFTGGVTLNGGTFGDSTNGISAAELNNNSITVNGVAALAITSGETLTSGILINSTGNLSLGSGGTGTVNGVVSGSGILTVPSVAGNGGGATLNLNNMDNTFTGGVVFAPTANGIYNLNVNSLRDSLSPGAGNIVFSVNGAVASALNFNYTGAAPLTYTNRQFEIQGITAPGQTVKISNNSSQAFTINSDLNASTATGVRTLTLGGSGTGLSTFVGSITNGGLTTLNLTKADAASTWALTNAASSYNGVTTVTGGTLRFSSIADAGSNSSLGNFATAGATGISLGGGTLQYAGASGVSVDRGVTLTASSTIDVNPVSTSLTLGASSMGAFTLNVTGGTGSSLGLGALTLTGAATLNPTTANLTVASVTATNLGLTLGGTSAGNTVTGAINTGSGTLTKNTASTWTLSGTNGYTGATNISAGLLRVNGSLNSGSAVTVSAGAIGGTGTVNGSLSLTTSGGINLANGSVSGTAFTVVGTLLSSGAAGLNNLTFDLASGGTTTDTIVASGAFNMTTPGAVVVNVNQLGGSGNRLAENTYDILTANSGTALTAGGGNFRLATTKAFGQTFSLSGTTTTALKLTTTQVSGAVLTNTTLTGTAPSWQTSGNFSGAAVPDYQSNVIINSAIGASLLNGSTNINSLTFGTSATTAVSIGAGTATAGTVASMLVIEAGTHNSNTSGNGITLSNASGTHTISANVGLAASQNWTVGTGAGLTVSGVISDFGGGYGLTKEGGGTLTLSGINTFTGPLTIANGTVRADIVAAGLKGTNGLLGAGTTLVMGANGQTGRLAVQTDTGANPTIDKDITLATGGTGEFQFGNTSFPAFTITNTDRPMTLSGNISGSGNFTKLGGSAISLSGNNTYTGTTTINEGPLRLSSATALPGGIGATGGTSALTINGNSITNTGNVGAVVALTAASGDFRRALGTGADQFQITGGVSGFEAFGSARQVVVGNDAAFELQWGLATFNPSALLLGYNQVTATGALTLQNKIDLNAATRTIQVNTGAATSTISGDIRTSSGTAGLTKTGGGTLALAGSNTYNGPTTVNAGTLIISGNHTGTGSTTVNAASTLTLSGASGSIGSSAVTIAGGTLTVSNANAASNSDRLSSSAFTMNGGTFNFNNDASVGNSFSEGAGTLTLIGGANTVAIQQAIAGQTSTLTFAGLSRTAGTLNFSGAGLGTAVDPRGTITFTSAPTLTNGIIGTWATVNGLGYATLDGGNNVVLYNTYADVNRGTAGTKAIADGSTTDVRIIESGAAAPITLGATTTTVRSILNSVSGGVAATSTIAIGASETLRVDSINAVATTLAMNVGNVIGTGTLTSATAGGNLLLINSSANTMTVNSVIANNTSASSLTKDGTGRLTLTAAPTYTGATTIQGGTFDVSAIVGGGSNITPLATSSIAFTTANSTFLAAGSGLAITSYPTMSIASGVTATFDRGGGGNNTAFAISSLTGGGTFSLANSGGSGTNVTFGTLANFTGNLQFGATNGNAINTPDLNDAASSKIVMTSSVAAGPSFNYNGSSGLTLTNRQFELNGTVANTIYNINNNGTGTFTINSNLLVSATGNKILNLGGSNTTANNTFGGTISDGTGAVISVTKSGASSWALTNANTYTGVTTVSAGTLEVSSLANGLSASNIGASSNAAANLVLNGGTLRYTGAAVDTDRLFSLQVSSTINASGTGALNFNNTGSMGFNGGTAAKTLTLTGTNTGNNTLAASIANNTGATSIAKTGIGTWVLSGTNSATGTSSISGGGTLVLDYTTAASKLSSGVLTLGNATLTSLGGGTVSLTGGSFTQSVASTALNPGGTFITRPSGMSTLNLGAITLGAGGNRGMALNLTEAGIATTNNFNNAGGVLGAWGTVGRDWAVSAASGTNIPITALSSYIALPASGSVSGTNYSLTGSLTLTGATPVNSLKIIANADNQTLAIGSNNVSPTVTNNAGGIIYDGGVSTNYTYNITGSTGVFTAGNSEMYYHVYDGTLNVTALASLGSGGLVKVGNGTLILGGANNYAGTTFVTQGAVRLTNVGGVSWTGAIGVQNGAALELANSVTIGAKALTITGTGVANGGALRNVASNTSSYAGAITIGTGGARINSDATGINLLTLSGGVTTSLFNNVTFGGAGNTTVQTAAIIGAGGLIKDGAGTTTLSVTNTYTGATNISGGILQIAAGGLINSSSGVSIVSGGELRYNASTALTAPVTFTNGTISGTNWGGTLGGLTIGANNTISPGNSPGTAETTSQTWGPGGSYLFEINNATALVAGTDPGWDLLNGSGALTISATSSSPYSILLTSLTLGNIAGDAANFLDTNNYTWLIADFASITGFVTDKFTVNTAGFDNTFTGTFGVALGGTGVVPGDNTQIYVTYTAIPEPSTLLLGALGTLALLRRRRQS